MTHINIFLTKTKETKCYTDKLKKNACCIHFYHKVLTMLNWLILPFSSITDWLLDVFVLTKDSMVEYNPLGCEYIFLFKYYFIKFLNINPISAYSTHSSMRSTWRPSRSRLFLRPANQTPRKHTYASDVCIARPVIG